MSEISQTKRSPKLVPSVLSGIVLGVAGAALTGLLVHLFVPNNQDAVVVSVYLGWTIFFLVGIGAFNGIFKWGLTGRDDTHEELLEMAGKDQGLWRYFRFTTDHKVVGIQYLAIVLTLFLVGGTAAFLIRLEQSVPGAVFLPPVFYNTLVGMHGTLMIATTILMVSGPFGNFILPIAIGARDMAFPRLNALSFWLIFALVPVFLSTLALGGFPTGWTGYAPLSDRGTAGPGMDAYCFTIILFSLSTTVAAMNIITTVVALRTKGMTWGRLPMFVWGIMLSVLLGLVAFPPFSLSQIMVLMDRVFQTSFFIASLGGSNWVYEHLFWFMGHPEVYVIALPSLAVAAEVAAVFSRKQIFGYKLLVGSMIAICTLGMLVWAHHLYVSGSNTALNGPFMFSTELISIPTGVIFLVMVGTLWRGKIWLTVPLLFVLGSLFNFVIGGVTGIFLADVPTDEVLHGSMFVTAHFHFTLVGGMVMGFFAALYYWFPKMLGRQLDQSLGKAHFWLFEIGFLGVFLPLFYAGLHGEARWAASIPLDVATPNLIASTFVVPIAVSVLVLIVNVVKTLIRGRQAVANEWGSRSLEWTIPTPVPLENFAELPVVTSSPYNYGEAPAKAASHGHTDKVPAKEAVLEPQTQGD